MTWASLAIGLSEISDNVPWMNFIVFDHAVHTERSSSYNVSCRWHITFLVAMDATLKVYTFVTKSLRCESKCVRRHFRSWNCWIYFIFCSADRRRCGLGILPHRHKRFPCSGKLCQSRQIEQKLHGTIYHIHSKLRHVSICSFPGHGDIRVSSLTVLHLPRKRKDQNIFHLEIF